MPTMSVRAALASRPKATATWHATRAARAPRRCSIAPAHPARPEVRPRVGDRHRITWRGRRALAAHRPVNIRVADPWAALWAIARATRPGSYNGPRMDAFDVEKLRGEIAHDETDLLAKRLEVERLDGRLQDKRSLMALAERLYGPPDAQGVSGATGSPAMNAASNLQGTMAMLRLIIKTGGIWEPANLLGKLLDQGWTTESAKPISVISGALGRLVQTDPDIVRVSHGQYRWRSDVMERVSNR
jgi:hypothetical protein